MYSGSPGRTPTASTVIEHGRMEARDVGRRDHGFGHDEHLMLGRDDAAMTDHKQLVPAPAADALGITVIIEV